MKSFKIIFAALAAMMLSGCGILSSGLATEPDPSAQELVAAALEKGELKFEVEYIIPSRGASRTSFDGYFLSIEDGKVNSNLPFFGVSHTAQIYGVDPSGIDFDDYPINIDTLRSRPEKGRYIWHFVAKSGRSDVDVTLTFFTNGSASLACNPTNRSAMNYRGRLVPLPEKDK